MVAQILEIRDQQLWQEQEMENVLHFVNTDGLADPMDALSDYVTDVIAAYVAFQSSNLQHMSLAWRLVYPTITLLQHYGTGMPVSGTVTSGDDEPTSTALSSQLYIGDTVQLDVARTFHIKRAGIRFTGPKETFINGNGTGGGIVALVAAWYASFTGMISDNWEPCAVSFINHAHVRPKPAPAQAYALITGCSDPAPSTQNSRKVLRGRSR